MIRIGRRGLHECVSRVCCSQSVPVSVERCLTAFSSTPACTYNDCLPSQPASSLASRHFTTASFDMYDPQGEMSAVTFHGPRTMKVSKKSKPRLQTPRVCMLDPTPANITEVSNYCSSTAPLERQEHAKQWSVLFYRMSLSRLQCQAYVAVTCTHMLGGVLY